MMAKFGPFCRSVNCSLEREVLERLITHLSDGALLVCGLGGLPLMGLSCVGGLAMVVVEGVGVLGELLDGTSYFSLILSTMVSTRIHFPIPPLFIHMQ